MSITIYEATTEDMLKQLGSQPRKFSLPNSPCFAEEIQIGPNYPELVFEKGSQWESIIRLMKGRIQLNEHKHDLIKGTTIRLPRTKSSRRTLRSKVDSVVFRIYQPTLKYGALKLYKPTTEAMRQEPGFRKREFWFLGKNYCNVAEIHLSDRYPEEKYARNRDCGMLVRIMKGGVYLFIEQEDGVYLDKGDTVFIPRGARYYWIPEVPSVFLVISTPAWTLDQHENVCLSQ